MEVGASYERGTLVGPHVATTALTRMRGTRPPPRRMLVLFSFLAGWKCGTCDPLTRDLPTQGRSDPLTRAARVRVRVCVRVCAYVCVCVRVCVCVEERELCPPVP